MWFESFYTFLGGLGIFFYGMKGLTESMQALSGQLIREAIRKATSNRFLGLAVGLLVTVLVQSSSITTVMVIGLVNANLMGLTQAVAVIIGANIGTTATGWIIAIQVGKYGLLLVGLGAFPLLMVKNPRVRQLGRLVLALGFVFMGLEFMGAAFKPLRNSESFLSVMQMFSADDLGTLLACVGIGAALTIIVQSSSAMLGITIALVGTGAITFQTAAALVLGENIGTTITAILASIGANSSAKRAARAHVCFNLLAVLLLLPFFWQYLEMVDWLIAGDPDMTLADGAKPNAAAHVAAGHSLFNITAAIIFMPFVRQLAAFVTWITPAPKVREVPHLKYLPSIAEISAPSLALVLAEKELSNMAEITGRAVKLTGEYLVSKSNKQTLADKVFHYENITDSIQGEITIFLKHVHEARLTPEQAATSYAINRSADELESIADYCASVVRAYSRILASDESFSEQAVADLGTYLTAVNSYFSSAEKLLMEGGDWEFTKFDEEQLNLTQLANEIRERHRQRVGSNLCSPVASMAFSDIIVGLRKLKGHVFNIAEAMTNKSGG